MSEAVYSCSQDTSRTYPGRLDWCPLQSAEMHAPHADDDQNQPIGERADESIASRHSCEDEIRAAEPRNLLVIAGSQIAMRIGWIFKTESIIIPAFLDTIAGAGWMRGMLPVLNRASQSTVPVVMADRVRRAPFKKHGMAVCVLGMAACFLILSGIWFVHGTDNPPWLPTAFLTLYTVFFAFVGTAHLSANTLQGKLTRPMRRARLMSLSASVGSVLAIGFALWLLRGWLQIPRADGQPGGGFAYIFAFSGVAFVISSLLVLLVREPRDARGDGQDGLAGQRR
jgi:hypothetical protein